MPKPPDPTAADLKGVEMLLAVTGGIAVYKAAEIVSRLVQRGAGVTVALTDAARRFVTPLTFQALSGRRVLTDLWADDEPGDVQHISLTGRASLLLVAPATANLIGKVAAGIADDLVTTLIISADSPVLFAPAMNDRMWANPIVQRNVDTLRSFGYQFVGPDSGWLACRSTGPGRMAEPADILTAIDTVLREKPT